MWVQFKQSALRDAVMSKVVTKKEMIIVLPFLYDVLWAVV
jgi:hypothetical protein